MPAQDLQDWLHSGDLQRATQRGVRDFAHAWNAGPAKAAFDDALASLPEQSAEAVAEAVVGLFADDGWIDSLIEGLSARLRADPFFDPPFLSINSEVNAGLIAFQDPRVSIAAGITRLADLAARKTARRGATSIGFSGRMTVIKFVRANGARLGFWEAPEIKPGFNAAEAGQCRSTGARTIADGEILVIDGRRQSYIVEHAEGNLMILQAEIALDPAPLSVEYDSASHNYVGCSANGDGASRIRMMTTLLRKLDCTAAFPTIAQFLDHEDFFVRWHVMRELLGLDAEAALPHLKRLAARDPHGDVRRAARQVLDRLDAKPVRQEAA